MAHRTETLPARKPENRVYLQQTRSQSAACFSRTIFQRPPGRIDVTRLSSRSSFLPNAREEERDQPEKQERDKHLHAQGQPCLLYTSDAADERSSVDLGGR